MGYRTLGSAADNDAEPEPEPTKIKKCFVKLIKLKKVNKMQSGIGGTSCGKASSCGQERKRKEKMSTHLSQKPENKEKLGSEHWDMVI